MQSIYKRNTYGAGYTNYERKINPFTLKQNLMANFKTCINGHNYDASQYAACPYCPPNTTGPDYEKTLSDFKNTMINEENADFKTTQDLTSGRAYWLLRDCD